MNLTQIVNFELAPNCPHAAKHPFCPSGQRDTSKMVGMNDGTIVQTAVQLYTSHGFTGLIGWHYYNEPMRSQERMIELMKRIYTQVPMARFWLWSNLIEHVADTQIPYQWFEGITLSAYDEHPKNSTWLAKDRLKRFRIFIHAQEDDGRSAERPAKSGPCARQFLEMDIDYSGDVRMCCHDWKGASCIGNIVDDKLDAVIAKWQETRVNCLRGKDMPDCCGKCGTRYGVNTAEPEITKRIQEYVKEITNE